MKQLYSFCESVHAGPRSPWHIRARSPDQPIKLGGGIQTKSLCGLVDRGWDLDVEINSHHLKHACSECAAAYSKLAGKGGEGEK